MKKGPSLRIRLTLLTSLLIALLCVAFTIFTINNATHTFTSRSYGTPEGEVLHEPTGPQTSAGRQYDIKIFTTASYVFMGCSIVVGSLLMYIVAGISLRPVGNLAEKMSVISHENLSERVPEPHSKDELSVLADTFNSMLDRLESAFEREQRFSAAAAHELKTPLTVMQTSIDVLQLEESPTAADYEEHIDVIDRQLKRMNGLVSDLFTMSRAADYAIEDTISITQTVEEIISELFSLISEKGVTVNVEDMGDIVIRANQTMITHALANVIENAAKYNVPNGEVHIAISADDSQCFIDVKDTGVGIRREDWPLIFEPFYRTDISRSRDVGGSGLGLAITKEIIDFHGGTISYKPNHPTGSVFSIMLPIN